jgi:hypothetical protein
LEILKDFWPQVNDSLQEVVLLAVAMTRLPAAIDFLLDVLGGKSRDAAQAALGALAIHRHSDAVRERVQRALATRADKDLAARFEKKFARER